MKEMVKRVREEKDGFTIAELLIVVAIVAVLVAIAIPVFTSSLNSAYSGNRSGKRPLSVWRPCKPTGFPTRPIST